MSPITEPQPPRTIPKFRSTKGNINMLPSVCGQNVRRATPLQKEGLPFAAMAWKGLAAFHSVFTAQL